MTFPIIRNVKEEFRITGPVFEEIKPVKNFWTLPSTEKEIDLQEEEILL